MGNKETY